MSIQDRIAGALISQAPSAEWGAGGVDRSRELAFIFIRAGIVDLTKLRVVPREYKRQTYVSPQSSGETVRGEFAQLLETDDVGLSFEYDGKLFGWLGTADDRNNNPSPVFQETMFAWSAAGEGNVGYHVQPGKNGFQIVPAWGSSSDWGKFRTVLKMFAGFGVGVVAPAIGFSAGNALGSVIVGDSIAAAYPAFTAAVGNVALSTALNGGDIETAVKRTALSFAGSGAGSFVGAGVTDLTGLDTLGRVAGAAAGAFVSGSDPKNAVIFTLAKGVPSMLDNFSDMPEIDMMPIPDISFDDGFSGGGFDRLPSDLPLIDYSTPPTMDFYDVPGFDFTGGDFVFNDRLPSDLPLIDYSTPPAPASLFPIPGVMPGADSIFASTQNAVGVVTQAAANALQLVAAYQKVRKPIETTVRRVSAGGTVEIAARDGFIHTQTPNGQTSRKLPRVGEAYATADSSIVVNNGNGTFTLISPNGAQSVIRYPAASSLTGGFFGAGAGMDGDSLLKYGALAVGAFFLLKRATK